MTTTHELSFIGLILQASWLVKLVMLILLSFSITSWYIILKKWAELRAIATHTNAFEALFWSGTSLDNIHTQIQHTPSLLIGMGQLFNKGYQELKKHPTPSEQRIAAVERATRAQLERCCDQMENQLSLLASIGSVSPYIGLLGTVWGIMNAFIGLGNAGTATLSQVAPGIAEALIATAIGLFAAIPAVLAYNRFTHQIDRLHVRFDSFSDELLNIVHRQAH